MGFLRLLLNVIYSVNVKLFFQMMKSPRWGTPYNGLYGEVPPEGVPFSGFRFYERGGISLVEVYERVGKYVISVCIQKGPKGL